MKEGLVMTSEADSTMISSTTYWMTYPMAQAIQIIAPLRSTSEQ